MLRRHRLASEQGVTPCAVQDELQRVRKHLQVKTGRTDEQLAAEEPAGPPPDNGAEWAMDDVRPQVLLFPMCCAGGAQLRKEQEGFAACSSACRQSQSVSQTAVLGPIADLELAGDLMA